jgi:Zn-dependent membrane protease YugP
VPVLLGLVGIALLLAAFLPRLLVERALARHAGDRPDLPGTGAELARHLLDAAGLAAVKVEKTGDDGDHYDPKAKAVRLSPGNFDGRSVTAVAVAAHEVGHALQDAHGHPALALRTRWVGTLAGVERVAWAILIALPLLALLLARSPLLAALLPAAAALALFGARIAIHALTLPVEFDASFARALPILERGGYLPAKDLPAARRVLRAAALTYVASACATLLDIGRWFRVFR